MAQADGVVANGTGAAVRSDLNGQLAALFTNHSGSTSPGTTYAHQFWADTNENVLKIRNGANDAWITLRELDGTMLIEDGSASTPGLAFADDTNTGIFSPAADQIGFATGGAERLEIGSSEVVFNDPSNDVDFRVESNGQTHMLFVDAGNDRFGIRTSSPDAALAVNGGTDNTIGTFTSTDAGAFISFSDPTGEGIIGQSGAELRLSVDPGASVANSAIVFQADANDEKARIDSSGRLLVGSSTASSAGNSQYSKIEVSGNTSSATGPGHMTIKAGEAASIMSDDDTVGRLMFSGLTGGDFAHIQASIDGSPSGSDFPGRLMFFTCADGASSPTERMRIDSSGNVKIVSEHLRIDSSGKGIIFGTDGGSNRPSIIGNYTSSSDNNIVFNVTDSERMRLNSSGMLQVGGTTSADSGNKLEVTSTSGGSIGFLRNDTTTVQGDPIGAIGFYGNDSNGTYQDAARIEVNADGDHATGDVQTGVILRFSGTSLKATENKECSQAIQLIH